MPAITATLRYDLKLNDVKDIGEPTRDNVLSWLTTHAGDFQKITDFHAVVGETEIPWAKEENEITYNDITNPVEE